MSLDNGSFAGFNRGVNIVSCFGQGLDVHVHWHHLRAVHGAHVGNFARKVKVQFIVDRSVQAD